MKTVSGMFTFPAAAPGSPILSSSSTRPSELLMSPSTGLLSLPSHCSSPRTRIRTMLPSSGHNTSVSTELSLSDYQGGREDLADTDKSKEQLYTEAKEILAMVSSAGGGRSPTDSPSNTGPRRPPRSKHDSSLDESVNNDVMRPSSEAASRLLIGTVMLSKGNNNNPQQQQQPPAAAPASLDILKKERNKVMQEVNKTTKELSELSIAIEEAERSVDMEQSLIGAEMSDKRVELEELEALLMELRSREVRLGGKLSDKKLKHEEEILKARERLEAAEHALDDLEKKQNDEMTTDEEMDLLEKIKKSHEALEAERRIFEDLEFKQMEEEAGMEAEIEDISREINDTEESLNAAENTVSEIEHEKLEISVNQDISIMQEKRENINKKLAEEKEKLADLETKLRLMLVGGGRSERSSEDSGTITWSEADTESVVETSGDHKTQVRAVQGWVENNIVNMSSTVDSVRSSTSDLTQTPSPLSIRHCAPPGGHTPQQRAGIPTPKHCPVSPPASTMEDSVLVMSDSSRPVSVGSGLWSAADVTDTSSWVGGVLRRDRASSRMGQRPLTRYLPVTSQQDFDLRGHIETAGHQVNQIFFRKKHNF